MPAGFAKAKFNDIGSVERAITRDTVAVMIEFVQGEAGVNLADPGFVRELRALCTERQLLLIADEVQTGIGRCGHAFAYEMFDIEPDLMTLAKGIGGGVPLSALLCKERINCFEPGDQGGTYCGNPLMAAAGLAVLNEVCREDFLEQVRLRSHRFTSGLQQIARDFKLPGERGAGLLRALVLPTDQADQVATAARNLAPIGLLLNAPRPDLLRFMPALTISEAEIDEALEMLRKALRDVLY
jgi:acetylornithine/N-succinyldiaminopimelate aminotransferase